jgi:hypothetical protein
VQLSKLATLTLACLSDLVCTGCGDGIIRREVSGTVTLNKTNLANGLVEFDPLDGQPTRTDALVRDGQFQLAKSEGLADGKYRVRISATGRTDPVPVAPGHKGPPVVPKEWLPIHIPDRYNRNSKLTIEVKASDNNFPFELVADAKETKEPSTDPRRTGKHDPTKLSK